MEGQLDQDAGPPIRQDGDTSRKLYAVPNKKTNPTKNVYALMSCKGLSTENLIFRLPILVTKTSRKMRPVQKPSRGWFAVR